MLGALDQSVVEFTHNPVFKEASPDDNGLAAKALHDLEQIIELSFQAQKSVDKLIRDCQQSP